MRSVSLLFTTALVLAAPLAADDYDDFIATIKSEVNFSSWPGKAGALKRGLNFQPSAWSQLAGLSPTSDGLDSVDLDFGMIRTVSLRAGDRQLDAKIAVAFGSTDNAQELLVRMLAVSQLGFSSVWQRGDPALALGDLNFVAVGGTAADDWGGSIAFVRNNVAVVLIDHDLARPVTGIAALAAGLDAAITNEPNLNAAQFNALRPQVGQFAPSVPSLVSGNSTTMNVSVTDPSGDPLQLQITSDGSVDVIANGGQTTLRSSAVTGSIAIELLAVDASLLFTTAQAPLTVTP